MTGLFIMGNADACTPVPVNNMALYLRITVICLVYLAGTASAAVELPDAIVEPVDIGKKAAGQWKFIAGDSELYKKRDMDDSSWHILSSFPHDWKNPSHSPSSTENLAWYRVHIYIPAPQGEREDLSLRLGPVNDADETYFNGVLIGKSGVITPGHSGPKGHAWDKVRIYSIPEKFIRYNAHNVLAVRVQSFFPDEAGFRNADSTVLLGQSSDIRNAYFSEQLSTLAVTVIILSIALYFFFIFVRRRKNFEILFLSLCCVCIFLHHSSNTQLKYILDMDFTLVKKLEYISVIAAVYSFMNYIYFFFRDGEMKYGPARKWLLVAGNITGVLSMVPYLVSADFQGWIWSGYFFTVPHLVLPGL